MKVFRILTLSCVAIAITAMSANQADAGFNFKNGNNIGKFVDRHTLWSSTAGGSFRLDTKADWISGLMALDSNMDGKYDMATDFAVVELGLMLNVTSLTSDKTTPSEYFSDADAGELTGVLWGLKLNTFEITGAPGAELATMTFVAGAFGANFAIAFDDTENFAKTTDPVLSRAANGSGVPWSASGATEDAPPLLTGIVDDTAGTGVLITIKNVDLNPGAGFGISATSKAFLDVTGGTAMSQIAEDGGDLTSIAPGTTQDIFVQTTFSFSSFDNPNAPEYDFTGVTGTSNDPFRFTVIPEPSSFALFGIGAPFLIGMALRRRKKNKLAA